MLEFFSSLLTICCCGFIFLLIVSAILLLLSYQASVKKTGKKGIKKQEGKDIQYEDATYREKLQE